MSSLPLSDVKARLSELVEEAVRTHERVTITRHGKRAAVLIAAEDFDAMEETLYWLSHPESAELLAAAAGEDTAGERDDSTDLAEAMAARRAGGW